jgi:hypothetical protein
MEVIKNIITKSLSWYKAEKVQCPVCNFYTLVSKTKTVTQVSWKYDSEKVRVCRSCYEKIKQKGFVHVVKTGFHSLMFYID